MTYETFKKQMAGLRITQVFQTAQEQSWELLLDIYWKRFKEWDDERFIQAVSRHIEGNKFFPGISDLVAAGTAILPGGEEAWSSVIKAIETMDMGAWARWPRFQDALIYKTINDMGGIHAIGESDNPIAMRAQFIKQYNAHKLRHEETKWPAIGQPDTGKLPAKTQALITGIGKPIP